jgi:hypothetical protein
LPQIRQIQRFVVDEQEPQTERVGVEGLAKGMETEEEADAVGCDDKRVCEYRQTGHL